MRYINMSLRTASRILGVYNIAKLILCILLLSSTVALAETPSLSSLSDSAKAVGLLDDKQLLALVAIASTIGLVGMAYLREQALGRILSDLAVIKEDVRILVARAKQ